ncbi:Zn-dependent peptidase ImmA (M78 family) [Luteibacter sp. Sphag1AF]|uniref:ImmA/IrrE family metallo-endopeptidase n=1 Tax=Luteibacter sp. Sphag1AF TaxID=2587031 RepID=UPI001606F653|nr:ImmA/IrrE family metallo-endopeptidase [Luteibacter sp. Sphag1AF]MBB3227553.1 Zn-dependent peptidase ImmA (M78 family) [Luteibacter sp. Sphag1AF]
MTERQAANAMLLKHWQGKTLPVDPFYIAAAEGIPCRSLSFENLSASGWYKIEDGRPVIEYNPTEPLLRQRFTVAHELGHHLLGHGSRPRDSSQAMMGSRDLVETAANRFAAELLMPAGSVQMLVVDHGIVDIGTLANYFQVSESAMTYRLRNLGHI